MKKFLCILLILIFVSSTAYADSVSYIASLWNIYTGIYGGTKVSEETGNEKDGSVIFKTDEFSLIVDCKDDSIGNIAIIAKDADVLLSNAATAGLFIGGDSSEFIQYLGNVSYQYITVKANGKCIQSFYGNYMFGIEKTSDGMYMLALVKL